MVFFNHVRLLHWGLGLKIRIGKWIGYRTFKNEKRVCLLSLVADGENTL